MTNQFNGILFDLKLGWDIFNFVNFENLPYLKLYSLLILTKKKKVKKQFKSTEKEWNS